MQHHPVMELKDLKGEDHAKEEDEGEGGRAGARRRQRRTRNQRSSSLRRRRPSTGDRSQFSPVPSMAGKAEVRRSQRGFGEEEETVVAPVGMPNEVLREGDSKKEQK